MSWFHIPVYIHKAYTHTVSDGLTYNLANHKEQSNKGGYDQFDVSTATSFVLDDHMAATLYRSLQFRVGVVTNISAVSSLLCVWGGKVHQGIPYSGLFSRRYISRTANSIVVREK